MPVYPTPIEEEHTMWKKLSLLAAIVGVAVQIVRHRNQLHAARHRKEARQAVQRWEDEGGNLPPQPAIK